MRGEIGRVRMGLGKSKGGVYRGLGLRLREPRLLLVLLDRLLRRARLGLRLRL